MAPMAGHDIDYIAIGGALWSHGPGRLGAGAAAEPGGRLRRRRHAAGLRHGGRPARGGPLGRGPGGRRRHGRRRGLPDDDDPRLPPRTASGTRSAGPNMLDTGAPFYEVYETSDGKWMAVGRHRGAVLRRAARGPRPGRRRVAAAPDVAGGLAGHEGALRGDLQDEDARRVVGRLRRDRRLRGARAVALGGARAPAQRGPLDLHRGRRRRAAGAGAPLLPDAVGRVEAARRRPGPTPSRGSSSGAWTRTWSPSCASRGRSS